MLAVGSLIEKQDNTLELTTVTIADISSLKSKVPRNGFQSKEISGFLWRGYLVKRDENKR